ncbi:MAG TPA: HWE histidine kinase domain-containing protein [Xanthobacteraceae bacterium]|nr:HWE histidine kinase domain-containing protein [Xanthobacteraceae bacterium]
MSGQTEAHRLRKQVSTLAEFGKRALRGGDISALLQEATRLVSDAIDVDLVKVLELLPDGENLLVRAGVNWNPGVVGHATIPAREGSPAGYALRTNRPVITADVASERRFQVPALLIEHGVRSTVNVVIRGDDGPFGVLEVDSRELRKFEQDDIDFLQNYANLLASAIDRVRIQRELAERAFRQEVLGHELQHRINNMLATIRAVARRTRAKSQSLDEFAKTFDARLAAVARTHALLSRVRHGRTVDIREIFAQELSAHGAVEGENLTQRGPAVSIAAKQAEVLSMAVHELATNAVKHGALSTEAGHIEVCWDTHDGDQRKELRVHWRERGIRIAHEPVRSGYGSDILNRSIPYMLHGRFERTFHPDGVECTISFALDAEHDREPADQRPV